MYTVDFAVVGLLAVYATACTYSLLGILHHYMLPMEKAFDLYVADLLRIAEKWKRSYNHVNITLFVVFYLVLIGVDSVLVYVLI